jgi:hypothetical protein
VTTAEEYRLLGFRRRRPEAAEAFSSDQVVVRDLADQTRAEIGKLGHEPVTEHVRDQGPGGPDDPVRPTCPVELLCAAAHQQVLAQLLVAQLDRTDLLSKPRGELVLVASAHQQASTTRSPHPQTTRGA